MQGHDPWSSESFWNAGWLSRDQNAGSIPKRVKVTSDVSKMQLILLETGLGQHHMMPESCQRCVLVRR